MDRLFKIIKSQISPRLMRRIIIILIISTTITITIIIIAALSQNYKILITRIIVTLIGITKSLNLPDDIISLVKILLSALWK